MSTAPLLSDLIAGVARLESELPDNAPRAACFFLRNITVEGIEPFLKHRLLTLGFRPVPSYGGYGAMRQDIAALANIPSQDLPDLLVLGLTLEEMDPAYGLPGWTAARAHGELEDLWAALSASPVSTIVLNTFIPPFWPENGVGAALGGVNTESEVALLNQSIRKHVAQHRPRFCLSDWERLVRRHGETDSMDYRFRYISRAPFKRAFLDGWAQELATIFRALKGLSKKCLVLDCDNTLWGGVIGEDGLGGIQLDAHDYPGRAFHDFQKTVLQLARAGVMIVLCSKNNEADVFEVLDKHPACLIKRSHLSAWRINWDDKATNLATLAAELNIGLDSFVFVDDSLAELDLIRQALPQVTLLAVPQKLHSYPPLLLRDGLFDKLVVSDEDRQRSSLYQAESQRKSEQTRHVDLAAYLHSLELVADIGFARAEDIGRVAQLTQKTNQFNLTTRRYTEQDICLLLEAERSAVFTLKAADRFGALGLVGVLIARREANGAIVDSLLISCRALGRGLETAFVIESLRLAAQRWQCQAWQAEYIATPKNGQVAKFWESCGFFATSTGDEQTLYRLDAPNPTLPLPDHITVNTK